MTAYYILDDKTPVPCSFDEWSKWYIAADRVVAKNDIGSIHVNTEFIGVDNRHFGEGPPLIFETVMFGGGYDEFQSQSSTWDEALKQHAYAMELARGRSELI